MNCSLKNFDEKMIAANLPEGESGLLGQIGNLEVRLACGASEIAAAQRIRYAVFFDDLASDGCKRPASSNFDHDEFDAYCDHLIVLDRTIMGTQTDKIIGTYRLMRSDHAAQAGGFYSATEFAVSGLVTRHPTRNFLELGRSCVMPAYRSKRTIELLWQGIWAYAQRHHIHVMMGCASFHGIIPAKHAEALSFLHWHARATHEWYVVPLAGRYVCMDFMPPEAINLKSAILSLPPLIKGYLRLGALFGEGAVIDPEFNTTDVMVVLPVEKISARYRAHYGEKAERFAA